MKRLQEAEVEKMRMTAISQHHAALYGTPPHPSLLAASSLYPMGMLSHHHPGLVQPTPVPPPARRDWDDTDEDDEEAKRR